VIVGLTILSAYAIWKRSKTRPKIFVILGSLLSFTSLGLLTVTIAFTVIFATKSARVSAFLGSTKLPQSIIDARARALGVSPVYKDQSYRELRMYVDRYLTRSCGPLSLSPLCHYFSLVHLVVYDHRSGRCVFGIARTLDVCSQGRTPKREVDNEGPPGIDAFDRLTPIMSIIELGSRFKTLTLVTSSPLFLPLYCLAQSGCV